MGTALDQVSETQANKATTVNEIVEALARAGLFGIRRSTTSALTFGYYGGELWVNGVLTTIADGTLALTASVTNYVEATYAGVVSKNTTGFTAGRIPLYELVTNGTGITTVTDRRICNLPAWGYLSLSVAGGAGTTVLTAAEARVNFLKATGALTGNRNVELPATPWLLMAENATSGAFTLTFKTNAGTGIAVTQGKRALLWCDGTDIYSVMTDSVALGLGTMSTQNANAVAITGGAIDGTPIGGTTRAAVSCTSLNANGAVTLGDNAADALVMTTNAMVVTVAGEITHPLQSAFLAYNSASDTDQTGDSTSYTVIFDTEVFDQNADYDNSTGTFTAPVSGRYRLSARVRCTGLLSTHSEALISLVTSNRTYTRNVNLPTNPYSENTLEIAELVDMDAADTAYVVLAVTGGTKVVDVTGSSILFTSFSGSLAV